MTTLPIAREPSADVSGRQANSPWAIPARGWKQVVLRTWNEASDDNIGLISSGVAFYTFLAIVPLLGAVVMSYGLIADVATVTANVNMLASMMPEEAAKLIGEQLLNVVTTSGGKKGFGLLLALAVSLYGGMSASGAVLTALNIAYEQPEKRGFLALSLRALVMTMLGVASILLAVSLIGAAGQLEGIAPEVPAVLLTVGKLLSYLLMAGIGAAGAATLYRYGPDRKHARWTWLTPGSLLAALLWTAMGAGFGAYVRHIGSYDATYGSLGAVVILLTWLYLSAYAFLLGAELNAELEHQTTQDTTSGAEMPRGQRGATMADTVAETDGQPAAGVPVMREPVVTQPGAVRDFATSRVTARAAAMAGLSRLTFLPSVLATGGLVMLRRRGRAAIGVAMLAAGGGIAWLARAPSQQDEGA